MGPNRSQPPGNPVHAPRASRRERQVCPPSGPVPRASRTREQNEERQEARGKSKAQEQGAEARVKSKKGLSKPRQLFYIFFLSQSDRFMLTSLWSSQRRASLVLRLRSSANGHQGAEPSADISPPFLSILQSGRPMLQDLCNSQRSASLVLRLWSSANGHQGGGAVHSTVLSHHGKPAGNTKREYASTLTLTHLPI